MTAIARNFPASFLGMSGVFMVRHWGGGRRPSSMAWIIVLKHSSAASHNHAYCVTWIPSVP